MIRTFTSRTSSFFFGEQGADAVCRPAASVREFTARLMSTFLALLIAAASLGTCRGPDDEDPSDETRRRPRRGSVGLPVLRPSRSSERVVGPEMSWWLDTFSLILEVFKKSY